MALLESIPRNWNSLQGPARGSRTPAAYLLLLSALDNGWQIVDPVIIQTGPAGNGLKAYHFQLERAASGEIQRLVVYHCPEIENMVSDFAGAAH